MQYLGGKSRIAKKIINYISAERTNEMVWVEPFMGSCKVLSLVNGERIGSDVNYDIVCLMKALQNGYIPPTKISEEQYKHMKSNKESYPPHLRGFVGHACSFAGNPWNTYARDPKGGTNFAEKGSRSLLKLAKLIQGVKFECCSYEELTIPPKSLIYCDPPYENTFGYGFKFDQKDFLYWCKEMVKDGHLVFISEYDLPEEYEMVWEQEVFISAAPSGSKKIERLYRLHKPKQFALRSY